MSDTSYDDAVVSEINDLLQGKPRELAPTDLRKAALQLSDAAMGREVTVDAEQLLNIREMLMSVVFDGVEDTLGEHLTTAVYTRMHETVGRA